MAGNRTEETVVVTVICAENISARSGVAIPNVFFRLWLLDPAGKKLPKLKCRTACVQNNLINPVWNERVEFTVTNREFSGVCVECWDRSALSKDDFLGRFTVDAAFLATSNGAEQWFELRARKQDTSCCISGRVRLSGRIESLDAGQEAASRALSEIGEDADATHSGRVTSLLKSLDLDPKTVVLKVIKCTHFQYPGSLLLTPTSIYFHSRVLALKRKLVIPLDTVDGISKKLLRVVITTKKKDEAFQVLSPAQAEQFCAAVRAALSKTGEPLSAPPPEADSTDALMDTSIGDIPLDTPGEPESQRLKGALPVPALRLDKPAIPTLVLPRRGGSRLELGKASDDFSFTLSAREPSEDDQVDQSEFDDDPSDPCVGDEDASQQGGEQTGKPLPPAATPAPKPDHTTYAFFLPFAVFFLLLPVCLMMFQAVHTDGSVSFLAFVLLIALFHAVCAPVCDGVGNTLCDIVRLALDDPGSLPLRTARPVFACLVHVVLHLVATFFVCIASSHIALESFLGLMGQSVVFSLSSSILFSFLAV